jgi:N-acetylneuraminate synthase
MKLSPDGIPNMAYSIDIEKRTIGPDYPPFIIAEVGINHGGNFEKAKQLISDAHAAGAECVKFQTHIVDDEMTFHAKRNIPSHSKKSVWDVITECALSEPDEERLKAYVEKLGMIFLSTPFSRAAADRLERLKVAAYKIGSGECNNYPLIEHIASFGKPIILSTGMNDIPAIEDAVRILRSKEIPFALLHCTSLYPTPYSKVRLGALSEMRKVFPRTVMGLSDHSKGNYTSYAAVALGASIIEKHFTSSHLWRGPDIGVSIDPMELKELIIGANAVYKSLGGRKGLIEEEFEIRDFAYASVVSLTNIKKGEKFSKNNIWVKRPGTGEYLAKDFTLILGKLAKQDIPKDAQLKKSMIRWKTV